MGISFDPLTSVTGMDVVIYFLMHPRLGQWYFVFMAAMTFSIPKCAPPALLSWYALSASNLNTLGNAICWIICHQLVGWILLFFGTNDKVHHYKVQSI